MNRGTQGAVGAIVSNVAREWERCGVEERESGGEAGRLETIILDLEVSLSFRAKKGTMSRDVGCCC